MSLAPNPLPETLSGHDADGRPTKQPHLAIIPLASVGHRHADGHIMGFAALLPESLTHADREVIEDTLYQLPDIKLKLGRLGVWQVEHVQFPADAPISLRFNAVYTKPCDTWASVTPVAFGHYPGWSDGKRLKVIGGMCSEIGLPRPLEVRLGPVSPFRGTPNATDIVRPKQAMGRLMSHVLIRFAEPVHGPVILGAGRFLGLGLFRPLWPRKEKQA
jgi:CRISPR-associated protein Csb2